jgi:hypothetical protein
MEPSNDNDANCDRRVFLFREFLHVTNAACRETARIVTDPADP